MSYRRVKLTIEGPCDSCIVDGTIALANIEHLNKLRADLIGLLQRYGELEGTYGDTSNTYKVEQEESK